MPRICAVVWSPEYLARTFTIFSSVVQAVIINRNIIANTGFITQASGVRLFTDEYFIFPTHSPPSEICFLRSQLMPAYNQSTAVVGFAFVESQFVVLLFECLLVL